MLVLCVVVNSQLLTWITEHHHMLTTRSQYPAAGPETVCMLASAQQYQRFLLISCFRCELEHVQF